MVGKLSAFANSLSFKLNCCFMVSSVVLCMIRISVLYSFNTAACFCRLLRSSRSSFHALHSSCRFLTSAAITSFMEEMASAMCSELGTDTIVTGEVDREPFTLAMLPGMLSATKEDANTEEKVKPKSCTFLLLQKK